MPIKARKAWALELQESHSVTIVMGCFIVGLNHCAYHYQPRLQNDAMIRNPTILGGNCNLVTKKLLFI